MRTPHRLAAVVALATLAAACTAQPSGSATAAAARSHDARHFLVDEKALPFEALESPALPSERWWGVEAGAGYRVEVPPDWNGRLVMYAHGYRGAGELLTPAVPRIRRALIESGYAWAASTYSANDYDVRAGVEDTNALALAFTRIAKEHGRTLPEPTRVYIIGHSMGGHIAAAAVEAETLARARHKVRYAGSMPMCGVLGDLELFDYYAAYSLAAQQLAGVGPAAFPASNWAERAPKIVTTFFTSFPSEAAPAAPLTLRDTAEAQELKAIVMNLSGGARPIFEEGFSRSSNAYAWGVFGLGADAGGVLLHRPQSTERFTYRYTAGAVPTPAELAFNRAIPRAVAEQGANPPQREGLRFVPLLPGDIHVPVLTLHNLGDLFVPISMEQIYHERVRARGHSGLLAQRAIRSPLHCDFTAAEEATGFRALAEWVEHGRKPAGDDLMRPATVAAPDFGCRYTDNTVAAEEREEGMLRAAMPACHAP